MWFSNFECECACVFHSKNVGDKVNSGDVLLVVESDKADMDVESFEEGWLAAIRVPAGGSAEVGSTVALMVESEDAIGSVSAAGSSSGAASAPPQQQQAAALVASAQISSSSAPAAAAGVQMPAGCRVIKMPALSSTMKEGKIVSWRYAVRMWICVCS
jgi:pyruvate dehydrogenase E2 component (dihydrolipoamide acetyltransferase)